MENQTLELWNVFVFLFTRFILPLFILAVIVTYSKQTFRFIIKFYDKFTKHGKE